MNKTAIKNFAVWARNKLITDITYKAGLIGVSEKGIAQSLPQSSRDLQFFDIGTKDYAQVAGADIEQRNALVRAVQEKERTSDYKTAFKAVIEEIAYTWFNRLIAIRFMEVNEYLPSRIRVLSSENPAKNEPDFVTTPFDTDMEFTVAEQDKIMQLKEENKLDELFRILFIKQCNKLHEILPELFEETNNYTELLLNISFTDRDGVVYHLVHDIPEDDFNIEKEGQVEIIGWLYQYYNTELNEQVYDGNMSKSRITKELLPAATTIYTTDWAIQYMVQNSLGRLWVEGHPSDSLKENWKYYLKEAEQEVSVQAQLEQIRAEYRNLTPEDIKVIDPCMGSGHILVYCFDVLMQIYESQGYTQRDAAQSILENNLFGLDIDKRAAQLAYFAVMMKARQYDRRIFSREIKPHVYAIEESNGINRRQLKYFGAELSPIESNKAKLQITGLLDTMVDAKEYGSILSVENYDWKLLRSFAESIDDVGQMSLDTIGIYQTQVQLLKLIEIAHVMAQKYEVVVTNPPYLGSSRFSPKLDKYIKDSYADVKSDLSMVMYKHAIDSMSVQNGYVAFITTSSWMFLSSFEKLRQYLQYKVNIVSLVDFGTELFDGKVGHNPIVAWVNCNQKVDYKMTAIRLVDYCYSRRDEKEPEFFEMRNRYTAQQSNFSQIPGSPIAYWMSDTLLKCYENGTPLGQIAAPRKGNSTSDNNRFLRLWHEVNIRTANFGCKELIREETLKKRWFPYNKGGGYRKWYGYNEYLIDWYDDAAAIRSIKTAVIANYQYFMKPGLTWSTVTSGGFSIRKFGYGYIFDNGGCCVFDLGDKTNYILGLMNSVVFAYIFGQANPTINSQSGEVAKFPVIIKANEAIDKFVDGNVSISVSDYDNFETSWDFKVHPLIAMISKGGTMFDIGRIHLSECYELWKGECDERFNQLKANEEELNRIFIDAYGLQDELTPEVEDKDVTVRKADLGRDIRSLISYAVGCMFGRYSLDVEGLAYAGGEWDDSKYSTFIPDKDNCIPITDEEYFEDDIVGLFCAWLKKVYGADTLEENLDFIASALGNRGNTSREVIRNYFLNNFIKDHIKIYQKRPIYWLFDSGKQNGFKALVYMHRWNADTVGNLRVEYLHKMQHTYEREIIRMQETIDNSGDSREVSKATKRKDKLQKQLKETKDYDAKLAHIALSRIEIDLDDGVKVNYEKVQTGRDGKKMQILAKI